jgi:hypothetical protein
VLCWTADHTDARPGAAVPAPFSPPSRCRSAPTATSTSAGSRPSTATVAATILGEAFYLTDPDAPYVRVCFSLRDELLDRAAGQIQEAAA